MSINIVGSGQLAQACYNIDVNDVCIFASGVSNSNCKEKSEFEREKNLLLSTLAKNRYKKFVYFSSCALSSSEYPLNEYYNHKKDMERIVSEYSDNYYIFRLPQLFGNLILHKTLINFIYKSIEHSHKFKVFDEAYRYVIEIHDVRRLVEAYLLHHESTVIVDLANPYRYKVLDIVSVFEYLMNKEAVYEVVKKKDKYTLDLSSMEKFIIEHDVQVDFGENYLKNKLEKKLNIS